MTRHATIPPSAVILKEIASRIARFRALLQKAQRSSTPKIIHDIRVSIRRLEAAADFYRTMSGDRRLLRTAAAVDSLMEPLGKLRDLHVQSELIARYVPRMAPLLERFARKIHKRMREHEAEVVAAIRRFPARGLEIFAAAVAQDLADGDFHAKVSRAFLSRLADGAQRSAETYRNRYVRNKSMKTFHKMRIALKHLRYAGEMLVSVVPAITERDVERIHGLQRDMGAIHDAEVLAAHLEKYLGRKDGGPAAQAQLQHIIARRDSLLKRFNGRIVTFRFFDV